MPSVVATVGSDPEGYGVQNKKVSQLQMIQKYLTHQDGYYRKQAHNFPRTNAKEEALKKMVWHFKAYNLWRGQDIATPICNVQSAAPAFKPGFNGTN